MVIESPVKVNPNAYPNQRAASLRAKGGKKEIAKAVNRKRRKDPTRILGVKQKTFPIIQIILDFQSNILY